MLRCELRELVEKHFGYLIDGYGYTVLTVSHGPMSEHCVVLHSTGRPVIHIRRERGGWMELDISPAWGDSRQFDISSIVQFLRPEEYQRDFIEKHYSPGHPDNSVKVQLRNLAQVLREYCEPVLRGDFSDWQGLEEQRRKALEELKKKGLIT